MRNRNSSPEAAPRRPARPRGLALLMTILVLASLMILGVSLTELVKEDFEEAVMFRSYNEAHLAAQEGMAHAMGFLMYDVWGVNEHDPFVCSQWDNAGTFNGSLSARKTLGSTMVPDTGGPVTAFAYDSQPLLASELELRRVVYPNVPYNRYGSTESASLVANWDWVNTAISGGTRVWQFENYGTPTAGRSRYTDAFVPTDSDVNDLFEAGLHYNRTDLQGYYRQNFPHRSSDLYAGGSWGGWGRDATNQPVSNAKFGYDASTGSAAGDWAGDPGFNYPFGEGKALDSDPVVTGPWNFVNVDQMVGDSFLRVFRSDLVDSKYENGTYGAMCMGPQLSASNGTRYGGAININEVNNNYEFELWPGTLAPNQMTPGSPDYRADNRVDYLPDQETSFYYSGRSYHYNEAKWIYCYDEMGKTRTRYSVTVLPDGGLPSINGMGNPRYWDNTNFSTTVGWFPVTTTWPGLFPAFDRGTNLYGQVLYGRASYATTSNTAPDGAWAPVSCDFSYRLWSDEVGANRIKNGGINTIRKPGMSDAYGTNIDPNYYQTFDLRYDLQWAAPRYFRPTSVTNQVASQEAWAHSVFAAGTGHLNHPKMLDYYPSAQSEWYAGPAMNAGNLKVMGQGIISHVFWHILDCGPIRTRAEMMMLLKKKAFMIDDENYNGMSANGLDENTRGNGVYYDNEDIEVAEADCQYLTGWLSPLTYHYTLDSLWDRDRVVIDSTGNLYMGGFADKKSNCYFWSGIESQSRTAGDPPSGYEGACPTAGKDDGSGPGAAAALTTGGYLDPYKNMYRKVKGKTGAQALLQELAQLRYVGDGLGVHAGGRTAYSPVSSRSDSTGALIPGMTGGSDAIRRANKNGALTLAYLVSSIHLPNKNYYDTWSTPYSTEFRQSDASGVLVNWVNTGGTWAPDITIWPQMHWRQAWEVASMSEWDNRKSAEAEAGGGSREPTFGSFAIHQYQRSTVTEIGRARVYPPYYQNDTDQDGVINGNGDFKQALGSGDRRLFLPTYSENPYNQWMDHLPRYANDPVPLGWRQIWSNKTIPICSATETDPVSGQSMPGITKVVLVGDFYRVRVRTQFPSGVRDGDRVLISGVVDAGYNGSWDVVQVNGPNSFDIFLPTAVGDPLPAVSGSGTIDRGLQTSPEGTTDTDNAYPQGVPLVMNYIELCLSRAYNQTSIRSEMNESGESLCNKAWNFSYMPTQVFRMWTSDYNVANSTGWTNKNDGMVTDVLAAAAGTLDPNKVRLHVGFGNSQPFLYVRGRFMQPNPATPGTWYADAQGRPGIPLIVNMFDQFDPIHWGVSVREADSSGNMVWVNYNVSELQQRAIQRIFGRLTDMTWGIGQDQIPDSNTSIDPGYRWSTATGNRGLFIRAQTPDIMQRGLKLSPNALGQNGNRAYPFESVQIDMPSTLAMRQLTEKHINPATPAGPLKNITMTSPWDSISSVMNMGAYLNSYSWYTTDQLTGADCDWRASHWWAMDGNLGKPAYPGGPTIQYDGKAPILPWKWEWDHSIDGHHDAYVKANMVQVGYNNGFNSPTAGNASMQSMTQGHPEQFKVIYFHPYFFPTRVVFGTRNRERYSNHDAAQYYEYFHPLQTVDNGVTKYSPNVITGLSRQAGLVTVSYSGDLNAFFGQNSSTSGTAIANGAGRYVRLEDCRDPSFNGVYAVTGAPAGGQFTYRQDGLPDANLTTTGGTIDATPLGWATQHTEFARIFNGGQVMDDPTPAGSGSWAAGQGAAVLPQPANLRTSGFGSNGWNNDCRSYYPVDFVGTTPATGGNANQQAPLEVIERVFSLETFPDYIGEDNVALRGTCQKLWTQGPWWVDGDEGQGPVEMDAVPGLITGDWAQAGNGARGRVVSTTGGAAGNRLVLAPCLPVARAFVSGDSLSKIETLPTAPGFLTGTPVGSVANPVGQRLWTDYGRYNKANIGSLAAMDRANVDPATGPYGPPPPHFNNTYLRGVLEFSVSTPWLLDNQDSAMWQYNSAYCFKQGDSIYSAGASTRVDPAFGNVRWYLGRGSDHMCQVFSLPTPGERNTNHIAWSASPNQRDRWANGIMPDPNRPGTGPANPGFNINNGKAAGSPVSQFIENKLELALMTIGSPLFNGYKTNWYTTPIGRLNADESDVHEMNWWDLSESTALDSLFELGVYNDKTVGEQVNLPSFFDLGKDPLSVGREPYSWTVQDPVKGYDIAQMYTNNTSYNDFIDNLNQGARELLTTKPLQPVDPDQGRVEGHYNADRETVFKINPNLMPSPMLYPWLMGNDVGQAEPTYLLGNKPARGYASSAQMIWYAGTAYSSYHMTNWNSRIWYKNQSIGPSAFNDYYGVSFVNTGYGRLSNMVSFSPAPVYTLLINGQSLKENGDCASQIRLTVGMERTWDGKCNILEYQINQMYSGVK